MHSVRSISLHRFQCFISTRQASWRSLVASLGFTLGAHAQGAAAQELTVASSATYAPFAFENKDKQIVGFDIDIINAMVIAPEPSGSS